MSAGRLLSLASETISPPDPTAWSRLGMTYPGAKQVGPLYKSKNGFQAFESALICFPIEATSNYPGLVDMASAAPWRHDPRSPACNGLAFALNGMSEIFVTSESGIRHIDLQSDEVVSEWSGLEDFCADLFKDFELHTGHALVHEWQEMHGPLPVGRTLIPIKPIILGGDFSAANLGSVPIWEALDYNYEMGAQLRRMKDGEKVVVEIRP